MEEKNELLDKALELKCKQLLCKLWLAAFAKPGYVGVEEMGLLTKHMQVQSKLEDVEKELYDLWDANQKEFEKYDEATIASYCKQHKTTLEKQKELAKEVLGKEWTIEELADKVEHR